MSDEYAPSDNIFSSRLAFTFSRKALAMILTTLFLAVLLAFSTIENINRARSLMESFLIQKGEIIIQAIEAGIRTSLMHHGGKDSLFTLIAENSRENNVVFISIINKDGTVLYASPNTPSISLSAEETNQLATTDLPLTSIDEQTGIFTIFKHLVIQSQMQGLPMMQNHQNQANRSKEDLSGNIILIGLFTEEYDEARQQDVEHALFMGGILFLVGSAGLYALFMYQGIRVANSTLANMRLYTDNVIESIPVGLITLDTQDRVVSYNNKIVEILGLPPDQIKGKTIHDALPDCRINCKEICESILDQSTECITNNGEHVPIQIGGSSLVNNDGNRIGTVLILRDMSQIKQMEQQLEWSRRMAALGKMAAGIAHEIRNPLGTLRGFAHFFGSQENADDNSKKYSALMVSEVDRLNQTVSGLLQFARPREPQLSKIELDELLNKTSDLMGNDFADHQLNFHCQYNTGISFEADADLLLQVLMNLLKNSISATNTEGEVSLSGVEENHEVRITVSDTGIGMTNQESERMFDPFFTTKKTGTGLGLAVSHQIIEQHHGKFEVISSLENGTTVTIILPKAISRED